MINTVAQGVLGRNRSLSVDGLLRRLSRNYNLSEEDHQFDVHGHSSLFTYDNSRTG